MPMFPNFIERLLFLDLNQGPAPVLDIWKVIFGLIDNLKDG
jgi:hypothetical protein